MSDSRELLRLTALEKVYETGVERIEVLKDLNLRVMSGSTVVVTGESGCGKSTLLNLVGGLDYPSAGSILVEDMNIVDMGEEELSRYRNRYVGFIFQFHFLLRDFTALENVLIPAMVGGARIRSLRERAEKLVAEVGLSKRRDAFPQELSGGERQRVAVARALMNEPLLILADEPMGNLDEGNARIVQEILFELVQKHGRTMVLVTHDRTLASMADRHFTLRHGALGEG